MFANTFRIILIPILLSAFTAESSQHPEEDALKVNYLLQLSKFIHWPTINLAQTSPITLCLFATTPAQDSWQAIHLRKVQNREIHLLYINQDRQISQCNILFVHKRIPNSVIKKNYYRLISNSILTIGERNDFAQQGGIIELELVDKSVSIKINTETAIEAGLNIHANLIEIASTVYKQGQP
jgi:hypothetical protein